MTMWICTHHCFAQLDFQFIKVQVSYKAHLVNILKLCLLSNVHTQTYMLNVQCLTHFVNQTLFINCLLTYFIALMLCAKFGSGRSEDCPAQTSDPSFARIICRLAIYLTMHYFLCVTCTLIEQSCIIPVEQRTKIPFLSTKKVKSIILAQESVCINALSTDRIRLLSAIFDRVRQRPSYA